jgi:hypothetical protein
MVRWFRGLLVRNLAAALAMSWILGSLYWFTFSFFGLGWGVTAVIVGIAVEIVGLVAIEVVFSGRARQSARK